MTFCVFGCSTGIPPAAPAPTSTPAPAAAPTPVYPDITGNWSFSAGLPPGFSDTLPPAVPPLQFTGYLQSSGPKVTGILRARGAGPFPCVAETTDLPLTGTLDPDGHLTMAVPVSGGVATFSLLVPQTRSHLFSDSSLEITGGECVRARSSVGATQVPNVSGTYTGTLQSFTFPPRSVVQTTAVTAILVQSPTPNADGQFPLSGTVTSTDDCAGTFTFSDGIVTGEFVQTSGRLGTLMSPSVMMFSGLIFSDGSFFSAGIANFPGCSSILNGSLVRQ